MGPPQSAQKSSFGLGEGLACRSGDKSGCHEYMAIGDQVAQLCRHDVLIISIPFRRCSLKHLPCDMWTKWVPDLAANVDTVVLLDPFLASHF